MQGGQPEPTDVVRHQCSATHRSDKMQTFQAKASLVIFKGKGVAHRLASNGIVDGIGSGVSAFRHASHAFQERAAAKLRGVGRHQSSKVKKCQNCRFGQQKKQFLVNNF